MEWMIPNMILPRVWHKVRIFLSIYMSKIFVLYPQFCNPYNLLRSPSEQSDMLVIIINQDHHRHDENQTYFSHSAEIVMVLSL